MKPRHRCERIYPGRSRPNLSISEKISNDEVSRPKPDVLFYFHLSKQTDNENTELKITRAAARTIELVFLSIEMHGHHLSLGLMKKIRIDWKMIRRKETILIGVFIDFRFALHTIDAVR